MEHRIEVCPFVQILDAPVPQGGNQLVEAFRHLDLHIPEQVIDVPKISSSRGRCRRRRVPVVQTAEQLVEVPTEPGCALSVLASKFYSKRELRGFLSGQGSTASGSVLIEQNVHNPVPQGRGGRGGPQGFLPGQDSTAFCGADRIENLVPRSGGLQGSRPGRVSSASSAHSPGAAVEEDGTGDSLSAAFAALRRLLRREETGERAEAEAAGGATVQKTVDSRLSTSQSSSTTSSCSPLSSTWLCLRFSLSPKCGTYLLCGVHEYAQCNLCRRLETPRYWCSSGLSRCPSLCNDRRWCAVSAGSSGVPQLQSSCGWNGGSGGGGSDGVFDVCVCPYTPPDAPNSGGHVPVDMTPSALHLCAGAKNYPSAVQKTPPLAAEDCTVALFVHVLLPNRDDST